MSQLRCASVALRLLLCTAAGASPSFAPASEPLTLLAQPGPWPGVSGLIGYGERLWFANSVKHVNHNSADVYSYDPATGAARYERHLFSQDAGDAAIAGGLLYWPFEDPRFSTRRGEFMVTDGERWSWRTLNVGEAFHVHAMASSGGRLYAALSAWQGRIARSADGGEHWSIIYEHPTPAGRVSRFTSLVVHNGELYTGLTAPAPASANLFRLSSAGLSPVAQWPAGRAVTSLHAHGDAVYGLNFHNRRFSVWRTTGERSERVGVLDGKAVRAFGSAQGALYAVTGGDGRGALWRSVDGASWSVVQRFDHAEPLDVQGYGGHIYVGTLGPGERGGLWGPDAPAPPEPAVTPPAWADRAASAGPADRVRLLARLDESLAGADSYKAYLEPLHATLEALVKNGDPALGVALSERLSRDYPRRELLAFGGAYKIDLGRANRWHLLRALARNGYGVVPVALLRAPWTGTQNRAEKYFEPTPAAAWAVAETGQRDRATLEALLSRLGNRADPEWLSGDLVGALTALTGHRFGYDFDAWRRWWATRDEERRGRHAAPAD